MGRVLLPLAIATQVTGSIFQARAAQEEASAVERASEINAQLARQQATREMAAIQRRGRRQLSSQRAAFGKSGLQLTGSPLERLAQNAAEIETEALNAALMGRQTAELERQRGKAAVDVGRARAGASLLSGAARSVGLYKMFK